MLIIFCFEHKLFLKLKLLFTENFRETEQKYSLKRKQTKIGLQIQENHSFAEFLYSFTTRNVEVAKGQTTQETKRFHNFLN